MARIETPKRVRGTQDIFGDEQRRFAEVLRTFEQVHELYAFQRLDLPVFEDTQVFARSIGETTDVVSKEMYTFPDRGGDMLTLRPEFTAGIARAYLTEGWQQYAPLKLVTSARCSATSARKRAAIASSTRSTPKSWARPNRRRMSSCWSWPTSCCTNWASPRA
ncbi:Histidine--tRNA ligase [Sphingomonas paucimobilis]|nr:Histidine--tRNA ligase [Sphingomonas paucimobilis]